MKQEIQIFKNSQFGEVRVTEIDGVLHFVAKDIAEKLGYTWNGVRRIEHVPEEWRGVTSVVTPSGTQEVITLSEQGLYFFLARSDKQAALPFQKWIAGEVIPSIRKTGGYTIKPLSQLEILQQSVNILTEHEKRLISVEGKVDSIMQNQIEAVRQLEFLPLSDKPTAEMPLKSKIRSLVNKYCKAAGLGQELVYNNVYSNLDYIHGIRLKSCKKEAKESYLDVAERRNCLNEIYNIISDMIKNHNAQTVAFENL